MSMYVRTVALLALSFYIYVSFCAFYFVRKLTYIDLWMSVNRTMSITSFPRVIPPYRCDEMDATFMHRIEKQMSAHPHVRLGHGSKDTAHVRVDTSKIKMSVSLNICIFCELCGLFLMAMYYLSQNVTL